MKNVDILYGKYIDDDQKTVTIGGAQTYIADLANVIAQSGRKVRIIQFSNENFESEIADGIKVQGYKISEKKNCKRYQKLYDAAVSSCNGENITIFATDTIIPKRVKGECIAIQHGIYWDIPKKKVHSHIRQTVSYAINAYKIIKRINNVNTVVCVDYNFINWYRAQTDCPRNSFVVIPNFTKIADINDKTNEIVKIIFARRFFEYRGTRVFARAIDRLLAEYQNIEVTVAGSGPDGKFLHNMLDKWGERVVFIQYSAEESLDIHADKHIAVIPTVGSEGTSLSLLEAMSAQCAVICSDVGGMTNVVLNGYNGRIVGAGNSEQLYVAVKDLLDNKEKRIMLAMTGYETVKNAFSYERWVNGWIDIISNLEKD